MPTATDAFRRHREILALIALGAIAGLGQVPFSLTPVALLALATAAWRLRLAPTPRTAWWQGFATGFGYFAVTLHWIVEPFLVDVARHGWMAPFALLFMAAGFALFWALAFWVAHRVGRAGTWRFALAFALALTGVELSRSYVLTGFPWALWGYVFSESPAAQLGAWVGPFGLTLIAGLGAGCAALAGRVWARAALALLAWALPVGVGWAILPDPVAVQTGAQVVRLIQPNAPQNEKWDPDKSILFFRRQLDFTAAPPQGAVGRRPDLIVWPETAVPFLVTSDHPALTEMARAASGVPVLFGGQRLEGNRAFNSLFLLEPGAVLAQTYDKHHLVPFGEYMPFGRLTRLIGLPSFAAQDGYGYTSGPGGRVLDLGRFGRVLPLICYEAIFPQDVAQPGARPDWLLQVTNDAWFGTFAGPQQHLAQARMRTIEQGLPMVRVANTGISAVIDPAGRIVAQLGLGQTGYLDRALPPKGPVTLYGRTGDVPLALVLLIGLLGVALARLRPDAA